VSRLDAIEARLRAATPYPWDWNSYSCIFSRPLAINDDAPDYPDKPRPMHREPPGSPQEDEDWCKQRTAAYEADPVVAWVPAHHGDTAIGRHAADAMLIEAAPTDLAYLVAVARAAERLTDIAQWPDSNEDQLSNVVVPERSFNALRAALAGAEEAG
jgi:hypothetical protein